MAPSTMQAVRVHRFGGPEELVLEQVARPKPQAGEVLVRVHAAGVLPAEWKLRQGLFPVQPQFPYIPGSAFAGVVAEVGPGVALFQPGQTVFGRSTGGTYAEYTATAAEPPALTAKTFSLLAHKPEALSFEEAAAISGGATTAWSALFEDGALQPGQRVLVHGAAGGVGLFAVQLARWKGAHVHATASTANLDFVHALGAETVIDYTSTPFEQVARDLDLVLDTIGGETLQRSMPLVKPGGALVSLLGQPDRELAQQLGIRAISNAVLPTNEVLRTIGQLIAEGQISAFVGRTLPLREACEAHALSQTGHGRGRIVLQID